MATTQFYIRPAPGASETRVYLKIRIRQKDLKTEIRQAIPALAVDVRKWNGLNEDGKPSPRTRDNYEKHEGKAVFDKLGAIEEAINTEIFQRPKELNTKRVKDIINGIVYREQNEAREKEAEKRREQEQARKEEEERQKEEARRVKFMDYFARFIQRKERDCASRTITNYNQGLNRLNDYQAARGISLDWNSLDASFFEDYKDYLYNMPDGKNKRGKYCDATVHKRLTEIRTVIKAAREEGITDCIADTYSYASIKETKTPGNQVYLTRTEVDKILAVDLSDKAKGYTIARDIFIVGICTAQRISDYNSISKTDIYTGEDGRIYIDFLQKKTGKKVTVPANAQLRSILEKYNNDLPHLSDQLVNKYIKEIAKLAGLTQEIKTISTKGGGKKEGKAPKYTLIHSHTARRTGATWMYLEGMDVLDICKVTGHESVQMLREYIKADELEAAKKLANKYDYFK